MLYKALKKEALGPLIEAILAEVEGVGPRRVGTDRRGKPIHQFLPVERFEDLDLAYETTEFSAKTYFLPFRERLSTYRFEGAGWQQETKYRAVPRALIGLRACDIHALLKLDKVFARDWYPSPYYLARRGNTFILGMDHDPCEGAFCRSLGTDTVTHGFDLFLTDIGEDYFTAAGSDRGLAFIDRFGARPITEEDSRLYLAERKRIASLMGDAPNLNNLPNLLDIEFKSPIWEKWGAKCLSCGTCAMVCPTCYCHGVHERISMDFKEGAKIRQLHACTLVDFAVVAGGHNFRPTPESRLKYRYYHQHRGFVEQHEEPKCVGCNRCGRACLAGIAPLDVIRELQQEEAP